MREIKPLPPPPPNEKIVQSLHCNMSTIVSDLTCNSLNSIQNFAHLCSIVCVHVRSYYSSTLTFSRGGSSVKTWWVPPRSSSSLDTPPRVGRGDCKTRGACLDRQVTAEWLESRKRERAKNVTHGEDKRPEGGQHKWRLWEVGALQEAVGVIFGRDRSRGSTVFNCVSCPLWGVRCWAS